ncbi:MAG: ribonuclease P protein component [Candidatus Levybacteria bacterium]|nr:ribonuclease P protein component [Candidatus Levybacteria bacterium]
MLKKKYRLPGTVNLRNANLLRLPFFLIKINKNKLLNNRMGIVASLKVSKRAVDRNRAKRLIRSIMEEFWNKMIPGYDILFILKKEAVGKKRIDFYSSIKNILAKEGLIR